MGDHGKAYLLGGVLLLISCGGTQPPVGSQARPAGGHASAEEVAAARAEADRALDEALPVLWKDMTAEQRERYMQVTVLPAMKLLFESEDPHRFASMSCETCHGPTPRQSAYAMPSASLPRLSPENDFAAERLKHPEMVKFMQNAVQSQMASLLQKPVYNPRTGQGFGCFGCHQRAQR